MQIPERIVDKLRKAAASIDADVYIYNGGIETPRDLACIEEISTSRNKPRARLFLTTGGGSPDAAYKMTRYFQEKYEHFTVVISGQCKSAGTLIAVGAHELAFSPYGELGPLDIQLSKVDKFDGLQSGLTIQDSLNTLEARASGKFFEIVRDYISANNGQLSFASASKAASDFVTQLYAPILARIDPEEVGARTRSMKIGVDYGRRLSVKSQNLKPDTLKLLSETYSSHSFVIDRQEAETLFVRVRGVDEGEEKVISLLGRWARFEIPASSEFVFHALSTTPEEKTDIGAQNGRTQPRRNTPADGGNPSAPDGTPKPPSEKPGRARRRMGNGATPTQTAE